MRSLFIKLFIIGLNFKLYSTIKIEVSQSENSEAFILTNKISQRALVSAEIQHNISGWDFLSIQASNLIADEVHSILFRAQVTSYAAGISEGYLLCKGLTDTYANFYADNFYPDNPELNKEIIMFIVKNYIYLRKKANDLGDKDDYWFTVKQNLLQLSGIVEGYKKSPCLVEKSSNPSDIFQLEFLQLKGGPLFELPEIPVNWNPTDVDPSSDDFNLIKLLLINSWGDLYTISTKLQLPTLPLIKDLRSNSSSINSIRSRRISYPNHRAHVQRDLRCSSIFKVLPDYSDVLFGHTTWSSYVGMGPRTFKVSALLTVRNVGKSSVRGEIRTVDFSSFPGSLSSMDDFYIIKSPSTKLVVIETTNDVLNPTLFKYVLPESALCWMRSVTANMLSDSGAVWAGNFAMENSGTYTNQWQIFDLSLFTPGSPLPPDSFWLAEEIPGKVTSGDMTDWLNKNGYWASYNIPYFEDISYESGNAQLCNFGAASGNFDNCWENCPRANIFRRDQGSIKDIDDMKRLLQYNDWKNDPLSKGDPCNAIACRRDLESDPDDFYPSGGGDSKISSYKNAIIDFPIIVARMGPTHDQQPVFCWSQLNETYVHLGQPDCFDYDWAVFQQH